MASNLVVQVDDLRRVTVKTSPNMTLRSVMDQACKKYDLNPDQYRLKYNRKYLDLSLSVRFASLAAGAKLELVKMNPSTMKPKSSSVLIALQVDDGNRLKASFDPSTCLWDILRTFEAAEQGPQKLNFTKRTSIPSKSGNSKKFSLKNIVKIIDKAIQPNAPVYVQPVMLVLNKEFNTIPQLRQTRLTDLGLDGGNALARLMFRETDVRLSDVLPLMGDMDSSVPNRAELVKSVNYAPKAFMESKTKDSKSSNEEMKVAYDSPPENFSQVPISNSSSFDREVLFLQTPDEAVAAQVELPDSFFELSSSELKYLLDVQKRRRKEEENKPLMTQAMRDRQDNSKQQKYPKTLVRIRFPQRIIMQAKFMSTENISAVYNLVRQYILDPTLNFDLLLAPSIKLDRDKNFHEAELAPAVTLNFVPDIGAKIPQSQQILKDEFISNLEELNIHPTLDKWVPNTSEQMATPPSETMQDVATSRQDGSSDTRAFNPPSSENIQEQENSRDQESSKKIPKWFKLHHLKK